MDDFFWVHLAISVILGGIGDEAMLLIAKLKYRPPVGSKTTLDPAITDFEFRLVHYKAAASEHKKLINLTSEFADVAAKLTDAAVQMLTEATRGCCLSASFHSAQTHIATLQRITYAVGGILAKQEQDRIESDAAAAIAFEEDSNEPR